MRGMAAGCPEWSLTAKAKVAAAMERLVEDKAKSQCFPRE
jgi:hypothetical protein